MKWNQNKIEKYMKKIATKQQILARFCHKHTQSHR